MSFTSITTQQIAAGAPTAQDLFNTIKSDLDDHETRLETVEGSSNAYRPLEFCVTGLYSQYATPLTEVLVERVNFNITLLAGRLLIQKAGSSGTTEIDLLYKRGAGSWTSVFSTRPSVAQSAGDYAMSTNGVLAVTALLAGDLLRLDITSSQTAGVGFLAQLEFQKT